MHCFDENGQLEQEVGLDENSDDIANIGDSGYLSRSAFVRE